MRGCSLRSKVPGPFDFFCLRGRLLVATSDCLRSLIRNVANDEIPEARLPVSEAPHSDKCFAAVDGGGSPDSRRLL